MLRTARRTFHMPTKFALGKEPARALVVGGADLDDLQIALMDEGWIVMREGSCKGGVGEIDKADDTGDRIHLVVADLALPVADIHFLPPPMGIESAAGGAVEKLLVGDDGLALLECAKETLGKGTYTILVVPEGADVGRYRNRADAVMRHRLSPEDMTGAIRAAEAKLRVAVRT